MKKRILISVVLAVLLVEVGFGVYVAFERKYEYALNRLELPKDSVEEIETGTDRELDVASILSTEGFVAETPVAVKANRVLARSIRPDNVVKRSSSTQVGVNKVARPSVRTRPNKLVADKVGATREMPVRTVFVKSETARSDDKSLVAKTLSTLKKPFGWIKSIGSKMR